MVGVLVRRFSGGNRAFWQKLMYLSIVTSSMSRTELLPMFVVVGLCRLVSVLHVRDLQCIGCCVDEGGIDVFVVAIRGFDCCDIFCKAGQSARRVLRGMRQTKHTQQSIRQRRSACLLTVFYHQARRLISGPRAQRRSTIPLAAHYRTCDAQGLAFSPASTTVTRSSAV